MCVYTSIIYTIYIYTHTYIYIYTCVHSLSLYIYSLSLDIMLILDLVRNKTHCQGFLFCFQVQRKKTAGCGGVEIVSKAPGNHVQFSVVNQQAVWAFHPFTLCKNGEFALPVGINPAGDHVSDVNRSIRAAGQVIEELGARKRYFMNDFAAADTFNITCSNGKSKARALARGSYSKELGGVIRELV